MNSVGAVAQIILASIICPMERGIADNVLEIALRGKPQEPFYMVGRMEGQSVVLRAEKGKFAFDGG